MPTTSKTFPLRTVHLDFHTGPDIPDVGADFDPKAFAATFEAAHVDSVTVFAKCHHGHLYYETDRPERHPGLPPELDLMGSQVSALHEVGIRAPIYLSVMCDEFAANHHPEWIAMDDLTQVKWGQSAFKAGWQILDMSSPYQDFLAGQIEDVLARYAPVDGIFLDMCWDQQSTSPWAVAGMLRSGLEPQNPLDRATYARQVSTQYMDRFRGLIEPSLRADSAQGTWFNSRPKTRLYAERDLVRHVEIEALPSGGWGYSYLPYIARFVRPLGLPTLSHTARFHKSWGDHGAVKSPAALMYECCQILSLGLTGGVGDLLHPRGRLAPSVYALIGSIYTHVEACEQFLMGGKLVSEIALVVDPEISDAPQSVGISDGPGPARMGSVRALQQLRQQFDIVAQGADLSGYRLVVIPESTVIDSALAGRLSNYLAAGGSLIVSGAAAVGPGGSAALPELGIEVHGPSPYSHVFLRAGQELSAVTATFDTVMYERTERITASAGAQVLCGVVEPYFERTYDRFSGHEYTVPDCESKYAAIVANGKTITLAAPLLKAFGIHGNLPYRQLLGGLITRLLPDPLLRDNGPAHLEATVVQTPDGVAVHLLSFIPGRLAEGLDIVNDPVPIVNMALEIRYPHTPTSVSLQPQDESLAFAYSDGYVRTEVSFVQGHAMVVIR